MADNQSEESYIFSTEIAERANINQKFLEKIQDPRQARRRRRRRRLPRRTDRAGSPRRRGQGHQARHGHQAGDRAV